MSDFSQFLTSFNCISVTAGATVTSGSPAGARLRFKLRTQEEGGLAHGLETAAAVLIHRSVAGCQDDQHPVVGDLLASCHRSFQEAAAPGSDFLTKKRFMSILGFVFGSEWDRKAWQRSERRESVVGAKPVRAP